MAKNKNLVSFSKNSEGFLEIRLGKFRVKHENLILGISCILPFCALTDVNAPWQVQVGGVAAAVVGFCGIAYAVAYKNYRKSLLRK